MCLRQSLKPEELSTYIPVPEKIDFIQRIGRLNHILAEGVLLQVLLAATNIESTLFSFHLL